MNAHPCLSSAGVRVGVEVAVLVFAAALIVALFVITVAAFAFVVVAAGGPIRGPTRATPTTTARRGRGRRL